MHHNFMAQVKAKKDSFVLRPTAIGSTHVILLDIFKKKFVFTTPVICTLFDPADVCLQIGRPSADVLSQNPYQCK